MRVEQVEVLTWQPLAGGRTGHQSSAEQEPSGQEPSGKPGGQEFSKQPSVQKSTENLQSIKHEL